ncbi:MAG: ferrochelatase [Bacteroidetes bacterium]|nr:ferrochelatase [Bacteroidota bacterium]
MAKGILLVNLGSPDSPSVKDVRKYLTQFLNDPLVIDINPIARFLLVNFIIVPFRAKKSAKLYEHIWTKEGSPLITHSVKQKNLLQKALDLSPSPLSSGRGVGGEVEYVVELGMRYQNPSIESAFKNLVDQKVESIVAIPLYPHWASSSTESTIVEIKRVAKKFRYTDFKIIEKFYDNEDYLNALVDVATPSLISPKGGEASSHSGRDGVGWDFFVFSYHGLPERQITKVYPHHCEINDNCCSVISEKNKLCYRAACYYTTRELVKRLSIPEGKYITSFQSRLDDKWLKPYSDKVVEQLAKEGKKKILVFSPAFVADCLETIYEIGVEYEHIFKQNGGEKLQLVESLNENPKWIEALKKMVC